MRTRSRGWAIGVGGLFLLAACSGGDTAATTTTSPVDVTTIVPSPSTIASPASACGADPSFFPTYPEYGPDEVAGRPGPAPDQPDVIAGQSAVYWTTDLGVIEARWPVDPPPEEWKNAPLGEAIWYFANEALRTGILQIGPTDDPCSYSELTAFGPEEPMTDEIAAFVSSVRPAGELEKFVRELRSLATAAESDAGRADGLCATPTPTNPSDFGDPDSQSVRILIENFLADRAAGAAASPCLSETARAAFDSDEALCLYECSDGSVVEGLAFPLSADQPPYLSLVVRSVSPSGDETLRRETYTVAAVPAGDGTMAALIETVMAEPLSYIDTATARLTVETLFDAIAAEQWDIALDQIVNEGTSQSVEDRLGQVFEKSPDELFSAFCLAAACGAAYRILEVRPGPSPFSTVVTVNVSTAAGTELVEVRVGAFEGQVTASDLPPDGGIGEPMLSLGSRLFGENQPRVTILRNRAAEVSTANGSEWLVTARRLGTRFVEDGFIVEQRNIGIVATRLDDPWSPSTLYEQGTLIGTTRLDGAPQAVVADGDWIQLVDLVTLEVTTLVEFGESGDTSLGATEFAGGLLVTRGAGDSTALYSVDPSGETDLFEVDIDGVVMAPDAAPDDETVAMLVRSESGESRTVTLIDANGSTIDTWDYDGPGNLTRLEYDGRWIIAATDLGEEVYVIDSKTGETHPVQTAATITLP